MYHWVKDKDFIQRMKRECSDIVNRVANHINNEGIMWVEMHMVGSGAKNLITQNGNEPIDLDYNIDIVETYKVDINDCKTIKEYVKEHFNNALRAKGLDDCKDSTSALTTSLMYFPKGNKTKFSIDLAIVTSSDEKWYRLIHEKTGIVAYDRWFWNEGPNSYKLTAKSDWLKDHEYWDYVRDVYLDKKNMYLTRNDYNHSSFICYIEAVNEVYDTAMKSSL